MSMKGITTPRLSEAGFRQIYNIFIIDSNLKLIASLHVRFKHSGKKADSPSQESRHVEPRRSSAVLNNMCRYLHELYCF